MLYQRFVIVVTALAVTFIAFMKSRHPAESAGLTALPVSRPALGFVQVTGDVVHPGIYGICDKKMTDSVIKMFESRCDEQLLLQAAQLSIPIESGSTLEIVCKGPDNRLLISRGGMQPSQLLTLGLPLDLNQVSESDLDLLPGIGPTLAHRIVEYRQKNGGFRVPHELLQVEGVGEKKYKILSEYFK